MKRFVIVTNSPAPYRTPLFNALAEEFEAQEIALHVLYCAERESNRRWTLDLEAQRYEWTILKGLHLTIPSGYLHFNPSVVPALRRLAPVWLLIGGAWHLPTMWLAKRRALAPEAHQILWTEGHRDAVLNERGLIAALRRRVFRSFDAFAVPNKRSAEFALEQAGVARPTLLLPNIVEEEFYSAPADLDRDALRRRLDIAEGARVMLSVAQLEDRKGVLDAARAFQGLPEALRSRSELVFLGEGPQRAELERLAAREGPGRVRVLGHASMESVRDWLWAADVFCLATRRDPNPLSPIEASFAGLPLLMSAKAGNVDELLTQGKTGWRIEAIEEGAIRSAMAMALGADGVALRAMGQAARENVEAAFRRKAVATHFVASTLAAFPAR